MALIQCANCGHMISDKALTCPKCGTRIQKEKEVPQQEAKPEPESPIAEYEEYDDGSKRKRIVYAVCGILVVLLVIGGFILSNKNNTSSLNDENSTELVEQLEPGSAVADENTGADIAEVSDTYSGLSFRTFAEHRYDSDNKAHYQSRLEREQVVRNLKEHGFTLSDTKTDSRLNYTGEEYYDVIVETYSRTINGHVTTVKLEADYTEISFPSRSDVDKFIVTVKAADLTETTDGFKDTEEVYWAGTDVSINGTTVTLTYKGEP